MIFTLLFIFSRFKILLINEFGVLNAASNCYGNQSFGVMIAAASDPLWQNGAICGKMFKVTCTGPLNAVPHPCTGKSVVVKMVDRCPGCTATLDLSREAFSVIANPIAGRVKIEYQQ